MAVEIDLKLCGLCGKINITRKEHEENTTQRPQKNLQKIQTAFMKASLILFLPDQPFLL